MKPNEQAYDDLTAITGIGPARQRWLRDSFNIRTYEDLVTLSVTQIESRLKADGQIASCSAVEAWLVQAQELATRADRLSQPNMESTEAQAGKDTSSLTREDGWKPFASFVVEFQMREVEGQAEERRTAAHHMEEDTSTYWPGIESRQLCQWILDQIRDKVGPEPEERALAQAGLAEAPSVAKPPVEIKITQIRVFQPLQSETPTQIIQAGALFQGSVKSDEPFSLEVDFELAGPTAADIAKKQIQCNSQSYVYDRAANTSMLLGDTGPNSFEEGKLAYAFTLPEATLQQGDYHLWVLVRPQEAALALPDFVEVPVFQVV